MCVYIYIHVCKYILYCFVGIHIHIWVCVCIYTLYVNGGYMDCCCCSVVSISFVTPRTIAHQAPLSMGFSRQEYWSRLPFPPPEDVPDPGIETVSPASLLHCRWILYHWATGEAWVYVYMTIHTQIHVCIYYLMRMYIDV